MASIDERITRMTFDNAKFETRVAQTMTTLAKLSQVLQNIGSTNGLSGIQKAANSINLSGLSANIDKLKGNLASVGTTKSFSDVEGAANRVNFGPFTTAIEGVKSRLSTFTHAPAAALDSFKEKLGFKGAEAGLNNIETASNKIKFAGASQAASDLEKKLAFPNAANSFTEIERASDKVRLSGITTAINEVTKAFSILEGAAAVALGSIASKAVLAGGKLAKDLSFGPITAGLSEYATNLNSIQTILANTKFQGSTLKDVNAALKQLNAYSDQTIYNFSQMAKNIGTFTAAGVDLDTSVASIKGIANLAALSGSNSQQASTAMYQLSQAIASGRVSLQDWNSVVNAGMGGATFQRALAQTAQAMGTVSDGAVKIDKATGKATINGQSFRESITAKPGEQSWLTSDVLTSTLQQFTGDLSKAELAAMGFNEAQIKSIQSTAITAKKAATEVKTLSGAFDVVKESIASGWAATFQNIFGDFEEAKTLFTGLTNVITGFVGANADARNEVLKDWKELGGRTALIEGIKDVFQGIISVIKPIQEAFREIFPKKTAEDLVAITKNFGEFAENLKIGPETAQNFKRTFAGLFAVLDIGKTIIGEIVGVIGDLFRAATSGSGGFLEFTANVGDWLVTVRDAIKEGEGLSNFFDGLSKVLTAPIKLLGMLGDALGGLFDGGGESSDLTSSMSDMEKSLNPLTVALNVASKAWDGFLGVLEKAKDSLGPIVEEIGSVFGGIGSALADALVEADFEKFFDVIQTMLIGGIFLAIKKGFSNGVNIDLGGGVLSNLSESFTVLTGSLKAMQRNIQADTMLKIGLAVTALAAGVAIFASIDPKRLSTAMAAVAVGLGQLVAAMALLSKGLGFTSFLTMPFIAGSMVLLATAIDVLAIAVFAFSKLSWEELIKGLAGVGGVLVAISLGVTRMPAGLVGIAAGLLPIAVALNIMAAAVKIFSTLSWEEMAKGLIGVSVALRAIGTATLMFPPGMIAMGIGLTGIAIALNILAFALKRFGEMDLETMGRGLLGIAVSLVTLGFALSKFPPNVALQAAGLILVSIALSSMAGAIALMGSLSLETVAKGLLTIGFALNGLSAGLVRMTGTLGGSAALLVAATALAILAPVLGILGTMKWTTIISGLGAMAALFTVLAVSGKIAAPGIFALGVALNVLAASVVVTGVGIYLLSSGLAKLGGEGSKGIAAVMVALTAFVALLPKIIIDFIKGLVEILAMVAKLAPQVVDSMVKIVEMFLEAIIQSAPKMAQAIIILIAAILKVLDESAPKIIQSGFNFLIAFLSGIANNIDKVLEQASRIIVTFLTQLAAEIPRIVAAGANVLIKFLEGLASQTFSMVSAAASVITEFLSGMAQNLPRILAAGIKVIAQFIQGIARDIYKVIAAGANLIAKILEGIGNNASKVATAAARMMGDFVEAAAEAILNLTGRIARIIINFLNKLAAVIRKYDQELGQAGANIASAIIEGIIVGIGSAAGEIAKKLTGVLGDAVSAGKKFLGIDSPSKVFMDIGGYMMEGLSIGVGQNSSTIVRSLHSTADDMITAMSDSLTGMPHVLDGLMDVDPTITPVLDLTSVTAEAKKLDDLTSTAPIKAEASFTQAAVISSDQQAIADATAEAAEETTPSTVVSFEQNNYSPEALSETEIYRRTKNQVSQIKSLVGA